jgi:hypothetical protein
MWAIVVIIPEAVIPIGAQIGQAKAGGGEDAFEGLGLYQDPTTGECPSTLGGSGGGATGLGGLAGLVRGEVPNGEVARNNINDEEY